MSPEARILSPFRTPLHPSTHSGKRRFLHIFGCAQNQNYMIANHKSSRVSRFFRGRVKNSKCGTRLQLTRKIFAVLNFSRDLEIRTACPARTPGQHVTKSSRFLGVAIRGVGVSLARPIRMILDRLASRIADAQIPAVLRAILDRSVEAIGPCFRTSKPARSLAKNCPRVT